MSNTVAIKLSPAQVSAIECADLEGYTKLAAAFDGTHLRFAKADAEALWDELVESANGEDAAAEALRDQAARRACNSLTAVARKVIRSK